MIYLITGSPGTGKTSMVVDMVLNNYEGLFKTKADDGTEIQRPLYFCHIDGLDARKFKAHELTEQQLQSAPLIELVPEGSVVIVDECDYTYPVRSAAREVPPYIKTLKELRHHGFTLILMTQHPSMIDRYVRQLVGKHIHLERKQVGTMRYEWFRCEENIGPQSFSTGAGRFYSPPKAAFKFYKSASKHIAFKKKRHWVFYALPMLIVFAIWHGYGFFKDMGSKTGLVESGGAASASASAPPAAVDAAVLAEPSAASVPLGGKIEDYIPRVEGLPETMPLYDNLRSPQNMETVAGCVSTKTSCNCYTEQGTKIHAGDELCRYYAENGVFQRYKNMGDTAQIQPLTK